jgi:3-oxoadipate enol-lactonase
VIPHRRLEGPEDAPVVVLSNSLGATVEMWEPQVPALTQRFRVLRYDHRGHGRSAVPPGPYTIGDLAGDVLELLDSLHLDRVSFCGLSMGGMVGMWMAAERPARIDRLALSCTSAHLPPPELWVERAATARGGGMDALADGAMERWFTPAFRGSQPETVARIREQVATTPAEGYAACCEAIRDWDFRDRLGEIEAPTLVIAAAHDPSTPPERGRAIAAAIPNARLVLIEEAAHLANIERPDVFTEALLEHLTANPLQQSVAREPG